MSWLLRHPPYPTTGINPCHQSEMGTGQPAAGREPRHPTSQPPLFSSTRPLPEMGQKSGDLVPSTPAQFTRPPSPPRVGPRYLGCWYLKEVAHDGGISPGMLSINPKFPVAEDDQSEGFIKPPVEGREGNMRVRNGEGGAWCCLLPPLEERA